MILVTAYICRSRSEQIHSNKHEDFRICYRYCSDQFEFTLRICRKSGICTCNLWTNSHPRASKTLAPLIWEYSTTCRLWKCYHTTPTAATKTNIAMLATSKMSYIKVITTSGDDPTHWLSQERENDHGGMLNSESSLVPINYPSSFTVHFKPNIVMRVFT